MKTEITKIIPDPVRVEYVVEYNAKGLLVQIGYVKIKNEEVYISGRRGEGCILFLDRKQQDFLKKPNFIGKKLVLTGYVRVKCNSDGVPTHGIFSLANTWLASK